MRPLNSSLHTKVQVWAALEGTKNNNVARVTNSHNSTRALAFAQSLPEARSVNKGNGINNACVP